MRDIVPIPQGGSLTWINQLRPYVSVVLWCGVADARRVTGAGKLRLRGHQGRQKKTGQTPGSLCGFNEAAYFAAINATVMSSMRLEKPHSLSYQLSTFTRVPPMTRVWVAS